MAIRVIKECRVCGKSFKPCSYCQNNYGTYSWKSFVCSEECWEKYSSEVEAARRLQDHEENIQMYEALKDGKVDSMEFPDDVVEVIDEPEPVDPDEFVEPEDIQPTVIKKVQRKKAPFTKRKVTTSDTNS